MPLRACDAQDGNYACRTPLNGVVYAAKLLDGDGRVGGCGGDAKILRTTLERQGGPSPHAGVSGAEGYEYILRNSLRSGSTHFA